MTDSRHVLFLGEVSRRSPWADSMMVLEEVKSKIISCISDGVRHNGTYSGFANVTAQTPSWCSSGRSLVQHLGPFHFILQLEFLFNSKLELNLLIHFIIGQILVPDQSWYKKELITLGGGTSSTVHCWLVSYTYTRKKKFKIVWFV